MMEQFNLDSYQVAWISKLRGDKFLLLFFTSFFKSEEGHER